jgi:hypothetical protein
LKKTTISVDIFIPNYYLIFINSKQAKVTIMTITANIDQIPAIVKEAKQAAYVAAKEYFENVLGGQDSYPCGFAWVNIYGVRSNSNIGRILQKYGFEKNFYTRSMQLWNPSNFICQNVNVLEAGARAAAKVFCNYGFDAYPGSRLD